MTPRSAEARAAPSSVRGDALLALKSLGFQPQQALQAVDAALAGPEPPSTVEELVAAALRQLARS